jgi:ABC-type transport system involved in multi-copper enzyme maturation permease subunit
MIWHIAKKEILENLTTYRFAILTGMLLLLMAVSLIVSYGDYELRLENFNLNHPPAHSSNVMIPPTPLSIFAKGVDAHLGRLYYIKYSGIEVQAVEESVNRLFSLFSVPDGLFIIKVMLSLIALLFSFDVITSEKEQGTLKLTLTSGANKFALLFGKLLGRFALVAVPFSVLFLASAIIVSILPDVPVSGDYWSKIIFILFSSAVYIFSFITLGTLLSSLVHHNSTSLVLSLAAWVFLVFVIPQMGMTIARSVAGVPPGERVEMQNRLATIKGIYERIHQDQSWTPQGFKQMVDEINDANSQSLESYRPKLLNHINITKTIVRLSPAGAMTFLLTDVADCGLYEETRFKDAIAGFAQRNFEVMNDIKKGTIEDFKYERTSLQDVLIASGYTDFGIIIIASLLCVTLSMISMAEYDPR